MPVTIMHGMRMQCGSEQFWWW